MTRVIVRGCSSLLLALATAAGLWAAPQSAADAPEVEVASIKLNRNCPAAGMIPVLSPGRAQVPCITARSLIRLAYGTFTGSQMSPRVPNVVGGPAWIDTDYYRVAGKTTAPVPAAQMLGQLARPVLEDRFKLKLHSESRDTPVYLLTVAEKSVNLPQTKEGDCAPMDIAAELMGNRPVSGTPVCGTAKGARKGSVMAIDWMGVTMEEFAGRLLSNFITDRPIINRTDFAGHYNLHLEFTPPSPPAPVLVNGQPATMPSAETLGDAVSTALQKQLGLKLTPGRAPVEVIVVDSIERPSEN